MFNTLKNKAFSKGMMIAANKQIEPYGEVLVFSLDTKKKSISMEVMLKGEYDVLKVKIEKYTLVERDGKHLLQVTRLTTSREWINILAATYLEGREFEVPSEYAGMLTAVI